MLTLSIAQLIAVFILGVSSFLSGWMLRRIQAKSREAQLQKHLTDANTAIPSLETNLRNRDQRIASLFSELTEAKAKTPSLEAAAKRSELEALAKERELRIARVEIDALKATLASAPDPAKLTELETALESLRDAQARRAEAESKCAAMQASNAELTAALAERDARLASSVVTPSFIALPVAPATESEAALNARVDMLQSNIDARDAVIATRDADIAGLQARLDTELEMARVVRAELEQRTADVERERAEGAKWQARVPKLAATIKARDAALAEREATIAERNAALASRDALIADRDAAVAARDAELAERTTQLQEAQARATDLSDQLATMAQQLEAASVHHATKLATALRLGREELDVHQQNLERLQADRDAQSARSLALETELASLQTQLEQQAQAAAEGVKRHTAVEAELQTRSDGFEQTIARLQQLSQEQQSAHEQQMTRAADQHVQLQKQLTAVNEQRGQADKRLVEAGERTSALEKKLADAHAQAAQLEQRIDVERQRHATAVSNATKLEAARTDLESQLAVARRTHVELEQRVTALNDELEAREQRAQAAQLAEKERVAQDTEEQTIELVELREEVRTLHTRVAPLESLLKQRDSALFERGERIEAMNNQIQALIAQTESLQATLRQRGEKIATLERRLSDHPAPAPVVVAAPAAPAESVERRDEHIEQRLVAQIERNRELAKTLEERDRDIAAAAKTNELNGKSMLVLKQQLDDARQTEERLAAQVRDLKSASQRAPEAEAVPVARPAMSKPNGLFELPPEHVDELQQIRGIGDGFERGLNKLGIYQFSQLAGLSAAEIAWIEAHLPTFHGRIERDDWPGQAAALMAASEHAEWSLRARNAPAPSPRIN